IRISVFNAAGEKVDRLFRTSEEIIAGTENELVYLPDRDRIIE
ncbi:hypothetical protein LCGC14_2766640, partial [marine sediment metagenome]